MYLDPGGFMNYVFEKSEYDITFLAAFIITIIGVVFFTGMLISLFGGIISRLSEKMRSGQVFYRFRNHIVILGYDETVPAIIDNIHKKYSSAKNNDSSAKYDIVLQSIRETDGLLQLLRTKLTDNKLKHITVVHAQRDSDEDLKKMHIQKASEIYIIGEIDEPEHDSRNLKTWNLICDLVKKPINVRMALNSQSSFAMFQRYKPDDKGKDSPLFCPYNFEQIWACRVTTPELFGEQRFILDYEPITMDSEKSVHLVINGMNNLGIALGIETAQMAHYPNFITKNIRTKITFIAEDAYTEMDYLLGRYKELFNLSIYSFTQYDNGVINENTSFSPAVKTSFLDVEWEFIQANIAEPKIQKLIQQWSCDEKQLLSLAFCGDQPEKNLAAGLYLPREVYDKKIPVLIEQHEFEKTQINIPSYSNVRFFGMFDFIQFDSTMQLAEEVDKDYCVKNECQLNWLGLPPAKKWSNIYSGCSIFTKLNSMNLDWKAVTTDSISDSERIELLAKVEHNRWNVEELLLDFRPTTKAEDEYIASKQDRETSEPKKELKEQFIHYDIRPYNDLRADDKGKNVKINDINSVKAMCGIIEKYRESLKDNNVK